MNKWIALAAVLTPFDRNDHIDGYERISPFAAGTRHFEDDGAACTIAGRTERQR